MKIRSTGRSFITDVTVKRTYSTPIYITTSMNCTLANIFYATYSGTGTTNVTLSNMQDGQTVLFRASSSSGTRTVNFSHSGLTVRWPGNVANNVVASGKSNLFSFLRVGTSIYLNTSIDFNN